MHLLLTELRKPGLSTHRIDYNFWYFSCTQLSFHAVKAKYKATGTKYVADFSGQEFTWYNCRHCHF